MIRAQGPLRRLKRKKCDQTSCPALRGHDTGLAICGSRPDRIYRRIHRWIWHPCIYFLSPSQGSAARTTRDVLGSDALILKRRRRADSAPSPPAEKATAHQDQTGQASADDGAGDGKLIPRPNARLATPKTTTTLGSRLRRLKGQ
jgi:hypothetical protein